MTPSDTAAGALPRAMFSSTPGPHPMMRGAAVAYAPEDDAGTGGLSIEAASALLDAGEEDDDGAAAAAAPEPAAAAPAAGEQQTQSEGETTPEDAPGETETQTQEGDENEGEETAAAPLTAPKYWSQDAKAEFDLLPPSLQAVVLAQEGPREQAAAKAKDEAAQIRAKADQELQGVQKFAEELKSFLPQAVQTFRSRWGDNPDWVAYAAQNGGEAMSIAKAQYEQERAQLQQVANAATEADQRAHAAYLDTESKALATIAPDLADPIKGPELRAEVGKFLIDLKIAPAALKQISAVELSLARDAMLWRRAQAKSAPNPAPKPVLQTTRPLARGAAAVGPTDPKAKVAAAAETKFRKSNSIEDAVALLNSQDA